MASLYQPSLPIDLGYVPAGADFIVSRDKWGTYVHLVVLGSLAAFAMAWALGANDVANAFGTSVGAKTLKLWQAVCIAAVFEFSGAIALGGQVAQTIAGNITSPEYFVRQPEIFMYGMFVAIVAGGTMVAIATYFSAAVSSTHCITGAVLGFGLVYGGSDAIVWSKQIDEFPYRTGVVTVFMSWFIAPISAGIVAGVWYSLNRAFILRSPHSVNRAFMSLPLLVLVTVFINIFFVLYKGGGTDTLWDKKGHKAAWVAAIVAGSLSLLCCPLVLFLKRRLEKRLAEGDSARSEKDEMESGIKQPPASDLSLSSSETPAAPATVFGKIKAHLAKSLFADIHEDLEADEHVAEMHTNAEVFLPATEQVFKYLQVFTACCVSFAHGANDVANAIGPFAGIWYVYNNHNVSNEARTPRWILVLGGAGIVLGLATYGYNVIKVLGVQLAKMTPSRGYCAELATGVVISIASVYGLPVSTTQSIVGAELGVGMVENSRGTGAHWMLFLKTFAYWVITFVCSSFLSAAIFALGVYTPSINDLRYVDHWQDAMTVVMKEQLQYIANTSTFDAALSTNVTGLLRNLTSLNNFNTYGKTNQYDFMSVYKNVTWLYMDQCGNR